MGDAGADGPEVTTAGVTRIVSLLPSATEIVFALGLEDALVAVTAECDHPPGARDKPSVSFPVLGDGGWSAAEVEAAVTGLLASGRPLYRLDHAAVGALRPDLVLAQDLCRVCAVASGDVTGALERLGWRARVLSLDPSGLDDVLDGVTAVAGAAGVARRGAEVRRDLARRVAEVRRRTAGRRRRPVLELEWSDPPFVGGHWVPDMVEAAGGTAVLARAGEASPRVTWEQIADASAEVVVLAPCGYGLARAVTEGAGLFDRAELGSAAEVWAVDGSAFFSRPGPRVVDGVELLASILHPGAVPSPPAGRAQRLR